MTQHTQEPWYRDDNALGGSERTICADGMIVFQTCTNGNSCDPKAQHDQQTANLERAVACYAACAGMADPVKEIKEMQAELAACYSTIDYLKGLVK